MQMPKIRTKADIRARLTKHTGIVSQGIDLDSLVMADGLVTFYAEDQIKSTVDGGYYKTGDDDIS